MKDKKLIVQIILGVAVCAAWLILPFTGMASEEGSEGTHHAGDKMADMKQHDETSDDASHEEGEEYADENEEEKGDHDPEAKELVAQLISLDAHIEENIDRDELAYIHKPAFEAKAVAEALQEAASGLSDDDAKRLKSAVQRIGQSAKLLDKYGDAGEEMKTRAAYEALNKAVQNIQSIFSEDKDSSEEPQTESESQQSSEEKSE